MKRKILTMIDKIYYRLKIIRSRNRYAVKLLKSRMCYVNPNILTNIQFSEVETYWKNYKLGKSKYRDFIKYYTAITGNFSVKYIPDDLWYSRIDPFFNNPFACKYVDNKNMYDIYFKDVKMPITVIRKMDGIYLDEDYNIISKEKAVDYCLNYNGNLIVKPSIGSEGGRGINFFYKGDDRCMIHKFLDNNKDLIVQEIVEQHEDLARLHKNSLNTIRIMTLILKNEVIVLSSVVRMGSNGKKVDNVSSGGYACGLASNGCLKQYAFNSIGEKIKVHPQGAEFLKCKITDFNKCIDLAKKLSGRFISYSKMISWDFSIDTEGNPILIEVNLSFGELDFHQMCNGPIFGDKTNEILKEILK